MKGKHGASEDVDTLSHRNPFPYGVAVNYRRHALLNNPPFLIRRLRKAFQHPGRPLMRHRRDSCTSAPPKSKIGMFCEQGEPVGSRPGPVDQLALSLLQMISCRLFVMGVIKMNVSEARIRTTGAPANASFKPKIASAVFSRKAGLYL